MGVQTRIDLWNEDAIRALARAGCVSIEAGVESITEEGRAFLDKKCKMSTDEISQRLIFAKKLVPFVQANLLAMTEDDADAIETWRQQLEANGVWANKPVPSVPVSRVAGIHAALGSGGRSRVGAGARRLSERVRFLQRYSGAAAAAARRTGS